MAPSFDELRDSLRALRKLGAQRNPPVAYRDGKALLDRHRSALGDEAWAVAGQTLEAALDVRDFTLAKRLLGELEAEFPGSRRCRRLAAALLEAQGDVAGADAALAELTKSDPTDQESQRQRIMLRVGAGRREEAVTLLNEHLALFQTDADAWLLLSELHLALGNAKRAKFCLDEVLLSRPNDVALYIRQGELAMSQPAGKEGSAAARARAAVPFFSRALELQSGNLRALWGLVAALRRGGGPAGGPHNELLAEAERRLAEAYEGHRLAPLIDDAIALL